MSHADRRLEVSEAAWRVIVREGLDRTTMRAIAQELGSTTGVVTHYFRDKDDLMLFALDRVIERTINHMQTCTQGYEGLDRLRQLVFSPLPLEPGDEDGWSVWIAFLGYAVGREHLMAEHRRRYAQLHEILEKELKALQAAKLIREDLDLSLEANALIAFIDGIGTGFVVNPAQFDPDKQKYLVLRYINSLLMLSPAQV
ncbi:TetR/AcrR family transcriptional regulator [Pseudanabaena sp. FACHB-2040]|uniref:TetR family transcriptional regulator C-terminal domain-containing protein n=1 Tax=Pseudanabaena sp. FACHB-2040 TaxID=2692859 RepID=UPI001684E1AD|nr:TetR family transcriptional regulator [Pseudanabaena sp. FACHB-2040]